MQRLDHLDSLRGFALFGILLVNMLGFQYGIRTQQHLQFESRLDETLYTVIQWFFQGSFYPVFAILFGMGGAIMYERAQAAGWSFQAVYTRRLVILLAIGFLHWTLIWHGDILFDYALAGFLLMILLPLSASRLSYWVLGGFSLVSVIGLVLIGQGPMTVNNEAERIMMKSGTYPELVAYRFGELTVDPLILIQVGSLFLIGAIIVKQGWIQDVPGCRLVWRRFALIGTLAGLTAKLPGILMADAAVTYYSYMLGGPLFGLGVIGVFLLLFHGAKGKGLFRLFIAPGKMALTNYLMQSLVMTWLFYGHGAGWFESLGILMGILLTAGWFVLQTVVSHWWLRRFTRGPVEWLWRKGSRRSG